MKLNISFNPYRALEVLVYVYSETIDRPELHKHILRIAVNDDETLSLQSKDEDGKWSAIRNIGRNKKKRVLKHRAAAEELLKPLITLADDNDNAAKDEMNLILESDDAEVSLADLIRFIDMIGGLAALNKGIEESGLEAQVIINDILQIYPHTKAGKLITQLHCQDLIKNKIPHILEFLGDVSIPTNTNELKLALETLPNPPADQLIILQALYAFCVSEFSTESLDAICLFSRYLEQRDWSIIAAADIHFDSTPDVPFDVLNLSHPTRVALSHPSADDKAAVEEKFDEDAFSTALSTAKNQLVSLLVRDTFSRFKLIKSE